MCRIQKPYHIFTFSDDYVQLRDQEANDYIFERIQKAEKGLMISKWGTIELGTVCSLLYRELHIPIPEILEGKINPDQKDMIFWFYRNAGFFPYDLKAAKKFARRALEDAAEIDILGSYLEQEKYVSGALPNAIRVNLEGYYAPFLWENPWTRILKGKKVLVVHPFADSIKEQYNKREKLFDNPDVLPEFAKLTVIKAIQSEGGNGDKTGFPDWFQALQYMEHEMDEVDYEIALIGCGAYGMSLAAHAKRMGKVAIHLASWTQILFGIYGKRWVEDQNTYKRFINEFWIRPGEKEKPENAELIEGGCYW